jgi:hypothetical protein
MAQFIESEMAKIVAADPEVEAARLRAVRRAGRSTSHRSSERVLTASH